MERDRTSQWREFEQDVADALTRLGWIAELTKASNDFGADVIATSGRERLVVQCKCFGDGTSLQSKAIREVMLAKTKYRAKLGLLAYRGKVSRRTFEYAMMQKVAMLTLEQIVSGSYFDRTLSWKGQREKLEEDRPAMMARVEVTCPSCHKRNRLPAMREGIMTCGHCGAQSFQRT